MQLDPGRLVLSPLEILCLMRSGHLALAENGRPVDIGEFSKLARESDVEFPEKLAVYEDLRGKGYVPRTGYKFGHHFRVYTGRKPTPRCSSRRFPGVRASP